MQSSAVVTFRALVMLLCLVLVPLAAIFGSALPQLFNEIVRGRVYPEIARPGNEAGDARSRGGDAPIFAGSGQVASGYESSGAARAGVRDAAGSLWAPAAARSNSADSRPGADALHSQAHLPAVRGNVAPSSSYSPAAPGSPAAATRGVPASADQFKRLECRLRDLGVTYYLLETWGTGAAIPLSLQGFGRR